MRRQPGRLGIPHPPSAVPEAPGSAPRTPCRLPALPLVERLPGLGCSLHGATPSSRQPLCARDSPVLAGLGSAAASFPDRPMLGMLSAPPGIQLSRGWDRDSGFSWLPKGRWGGEAGRQSAPCSAPGCGRPHRKIRANQGAGAGLSSSRPPSGLIESYIKKFSSERGERRGRRREGQRRRERGRACQTGRSTLESLKPERDNQLGIFQATVTRRSSRESPSPQLWRFLQEVKRLEQYWHRREMVCLMLWKISLSWRSAIGCCVCVKYQKSSDPVGNRDEMWREWLTTNLWICFLELLICQPEATHFTKRKRFAASDFSPNWCYQMHGFLCVGTDHS